MSKKTVKCPKCGSTNFEVVDNGRRALSAGKGCLGMLIAWPLAILGAITGSKKKATLVCHDCGHTWKQKI